MIGDAVQGSRFEALVALRDHYAARLEGASDRDAAALGRRLEGVLAELEALKEPDDNALENELARKRALRVASADS